MECPPSKSRTNDLYAAGGTARAFTMKEGGGCCGLLVDFVVIDRGSSTDAARGVAVRVLGAGHPFARGGMELFGLQP